MAPKSNQLLYEKMLTEQEVYRSWLLSQSSEEILNHTFEYTARQEILIAVKELLPPETQVAALLASPAPLADIYKDFRDYDTDLTDVIWACIQERAEKLLEGRGYDTSK